MDEEHRGCLLGNISHFRRLQKQKRRVAGCFPGQENSEDKSHMSLSAFLSTALSTHAVRERNHLVVNNPAWVDNQGEKAIIYNEICVRDSVTV